MHVLGALLHLIFGASKLDDVTLVRRVWEVDDNLQEGVIYSQLRQMQELLCQTHAKVGGILRIPFPIWKRVTMLVASGQKNYLLIHIRY